MTTTSSSGRQGGGERSGFGGRTGPPGGRPGFSGGRTGPPGGRQGFSGGRRPGGRPRYYARRKLCHFCVDKVKHIDYKDVDRLRRFLSERFKMEGRRRTGNCAKHQRRLISAIKRARMLAMLPLSQTHRMPAQSWAPRRRPAVAEAATTEEVNNTSESVESAVAEAATTEEVNNTSESVESAVAEAATTEEVNNTSESVEPTVAEHDIDVSETAGNEETSQMSSEAVSDEKEKGKA